MFLRKYLLNYIPKSINNYTKSIFLFSSLSIFSIYNTNSFNNINNNKIFGFKKFQYNNNLTFCSFFSNYDNKADEILNYWFGETNEEMKFSLWYGMTPEIDNEIKEKYGNLVEKAMIKHKDLKNWENSSKGCLAKVILLDQFTRNIYRRQPKAFEADPEARRLARICVDKYWDTYTIVEKAFILLPFEHSENKEDHEYLLKLALKLTDEAEENESTKKFEHLALVSLKWAVKHKLIVDEFGRYPHRNDVLGRESTKEEIEFLKNGPRFGQ